MIPFLEIGLHLKRGEHTEIVESVDGSAPHVVYRDDLLRVEMTEQERLGGGWQFSSAAARSGCQ